VGLEGVGEGDRDAQKTRGKTRCVSRFYFSHERDVRSNRTSPHAPYGSVKKEEKEREGGEREGGKAE